LNAYLPALFYGNGNLRYDYGVMIAANTSSLGYGRLGDVIGSQGFTFTYPEPVEYWLMGYPAAAPYDGNALVWTTAGEASWDNPNGLAGPPPTGAGSNQTGGSGGGAWLTGARLGAAGFIASVNSYKYGGEPLEYYGPWQNGDTNTFWNAVRSLYP
jgi:hypothetical protein